MKEKKILFTLKPISLTEREMDLFLWIYSRKNHIWPINTANYPLPGVHTLEESGLLVKKDGGRSISKIGLELINSMPKIITCGKCENCGNKELKTKEILNLMYSEPDKKCTICGNKLFEAKKDEQVL